jgi:hypothetical protein
MKRRPESTTSERELILALAEGGRAVPLASLALWRKHGLMPPLGSCGVGRGRSYYWREPDIRARARIVFDLLEKQSHVDAALWSLWLRGFPVAAERLRRAWRESARLRMRWAPATVSPKQSYDGSQGAGSVLIQATRLMGNAFPPDRRTAAVIEHATARLARANARFDGVSGANLWTLLQMAGLALESSDLLETIDEDGLAAAQPYLRLAASLLEDSAGESDAWNGWLAERVGPPLTLVILALLRSGQKSVLEDVARHLDDKGQQRRPVSHGGHRVQA